MSAPESSRGSSKTNISRTPTARDLPFSSIESRDFRTSFPQYYIRRKQFKTNHLRKNFWKKCIKITCHSNEILFSTSVSDRETWDLQFKIRSKWLSFHVLMLNKWNCLFAHSKNIVFWKFLSKFDDFFQNFTEIIAFSCIFPMFSINDWFSIVSFYVISGEKTF